MQQSPERYEREAMTNDEIKKVIIEGVLWAALWVIVIFAALAGLKSYSDKVDRVPTQEEKLAAQNKRLMRICDKVRDKKVADLTTNDHELIKACNEWDVPRIEELAPHLRSGF
jgi:hypothetical protein